MGERKKEEEGNGIEKEGRRGEWEREGRKKRGMGRKKKEEEEVQTRGG